MTFENTKLWSDAFGVRKNDPYAEQRELLRSQLLGMRRKVSQLVTQIPVDCRELTIHDVSHLDALWVTAQEIAGDKWQMNPAEAFVFGAAALIHDAGLTTIAYPGGKEDLKASALWQDAAAPYQDHVVDPQTKTTTSLLSPEAEASVVFEVLRSLHAKQAESLSTQSWDIPGGGHIYLIDDSELREAYGESIGRVAASHHWSPEQVLSQLSSHAGGSTILPAEWTLNECKLGCLIRCADAAQVDRTRAPLTLYAALGPRGVSSLHWRAQSKLNRPTLKADAIHFSSSSSFGPSEAEAWWIAYDLASILERELRASNAILTEIGEVTFTAQRVAGSGLPDAFAKYVRPQKWRPIDASIRVTDPLKLAKTLGGRHLYGQSRIVPFRELLQNSADAIRARRALEQRGQEFGQINISVEQHPSGEGKCLVHIDDNGIGMSERVLGTTLVDFGKSLWTSSIIREEFPGLKSSGVRHIGKFGIGFFSVFEVSEHVRVISKRYDAGVTEIRALDFNGLVTRPLLREATHGELPVDTNTRITLSVDKDILSVSDSDEDEFHFYRGHYRSNAPYKKTGFDKMVLGICSFLDIEVNFSDKRNGTSFKHLPNVYNKDASLLIAELPLLRGGETRHFSAASSLRPLVSPNGDSHGRAALDIDALLNPRSAQRGLVSVGGIVSAGRHQDLEAKTGASIPYYGVIEGETERAARDVFRLTAPSDATHEWLMAQIKGVDQEMLRVSEIMTLASFAITATGFDSGLPFGFHKNSTRTYSEIERVISEKSAIFFPITWRYDSWPEAFGYNTLPPEYFEASVSDNVIVIASGSERLLEEDDAKAAKRIGHGAVPRDSIIKAWPACRPLIALIEHTWQCECSFQIESRPIFSTKISSLSGARWVLTTERPSGGNAA